MSAVPFGTTDLPDARMLIEASAGTGKTHALTGLAVHLLGRGEVGIDRLLVVTYTRKATAELRARIRSTLAATLAGLAAPQGTEGDGAVVDALAAWDAKTARSNLRAALGRYDTVTVTTIHGFAQRALGSLGSAAGVDPDFSVLADAGTLIAEAAADELAIAAQLAVEGVDPVGEDDSGWSRRAAVAARLPSLDHVADTASTMAARPELQVLPDSRAPSLDVLRELLADDDTSKVELQVALARRAVQVVAARRQAAGLRSYDELLTGLRDALDGPAGDSVRERLTKQFTVALIDEFQDTDQIQWDIFDRCFGRDGSRLILVGDPKQAIYGFRGADVHTYARVASLEGIEHRSLTTNWRSDADLLAGLEALWRGATFGEGISFVPVHAAPGHEGSRLRHLGDGPVAPVEIALADTEALKAKPTSKYLSGAIAKEIIERYLVTHVIDLLDNMTLADDDEPGRARPVRPDDIALLTRTNTEGELLAAALRSAEIPAVVHGNGDVRTTRGPHHGADTPSEAAESWRFLLEAVAEPTDLKRVRAAAVGIFGPLRDPRELLAIDEDRIAAFQDRIVGWADALARSGPTSLVGRIWSESDVVARVLARPEGDRLMTDLEHLADLFALRVGTAPVAPDRLLQVLDVEPGADSTGAEKVSNRRIPTDAPAVTIMTVHKAKGLQFPIVGCFGLQKLQATREARFTDPDSGRRVLDLTGEAASIEAARAEEREENLRQLYVALTRARHHVFTCWTHEMNSPNGGLTRLLFARDPMGDVDAEGLFVDKIPIPPAAEAIEALEGLVERSGGTVGLRVLSDDDAAPLPVWSPPVTDSGDGADRSRVRPSDLETARLGRVLDRRAGRWSFTAITARDAARPHRDDLLGGPGDDEGQTHHDATYGVEVATDPVAGDGAVSPLAWLPAGAAFGTLLHAVLERVDFTADDLEGHLRTELADELARRPMELTPTGPAGGIGSGRDVCVEGLATALRTPLGRLWGDRRLMDLGAADRLSECDFELRLDAPPSRALTPAVIGSLCLEHLDTDDPYREWAQGLANGRMKSDLAGHLTGSIDLVARVGSAAEPRFMVVDYKSNRLHPAGVRPAPDAYGSAALVGAMIEHDYPLQALLYSVALHRYLRWRLAGYDPAVHLGGVSYLFLRGMTPAAAVAPGTDPPGVAAWKLPCDLIEALDARFAGRRVPA